MRKSFDELWEAMEARRQQVEAGEVPLAHGFDETRQARRQSHGCPDEGTLCGWVDGELRLNSRRRWLMVWQHVQIRRCRECQAEIMALAAGKPSMQFRSPGLAPVLRRMMVPLHRVKAPLAWGSSVLVVMVGLSLWPLDMYGTFRMGKARSEAPPIEEAGTPRTGDAEDSFDAHTEPIIWGD